MKADSLPLRLIRRFRFRLWVAMVLMVPAAVWLGWVVNRARQQERIVAAIQRVGGRVYFDYQFDNRFQVIRDELQPTAPAFLRRLIGDAYFCDPVFASFPGQSGIGDEYLVELAQFPRLRFLHLDGSRITDSGLRSIRDLSALQCINLSSTNITDAGLEHLAGMTEMQILYLGSLKGKGVSDHGIFHLKEMKNLNCLYLNDQKIGDEGLKVIAGMPALRILLLRNTKVTDTGLVYLRSLRYLKSLDLSGTKVTSAGLTKLDGLVNLEAIFLQGTDVDGEGVSHLAQQLPKLRFLQVNPTVSHHPATADLIKKKPGIAVIREN